MRLKNVKKVLSGALIAGVMLSSSANAFASLTTTNIDGGTWTYGTSGDFTNSNYYHSARTHNSTAVGKNTVQTPWTQKGVTSYAKTPKALFGNKSYYDWR